MINMIGALGGDPVPCVDSNELAQHLAERMTLINHGQSASGGGKTCRGHKGDGSQRK